MKTFIALVHKDEDSAWGVTFPDLPGCFSTADTLAEVLPQAVEALELWFEDQPLAEPRSMEAIKAEVADDLAEGAFLMAVPYMHTTGKPVRVNVSLDRGMLDAIDAAAAARRLTRSAFLAEAARNEIRGVH
ncbi:type II toxin-antitoxin system HicB family antitoxin [Novosphingobium capsulatum]|uniref:type II toxin-antitoxin system HicB family antitoxin n=1 Tax=Novosphingobium capsulatum TaxID=13688 RepID=UPI0007874929|nr:type II toxin-antitoxin system HicB family antitoxin [Novosphingobium capsulatum]WQD92551.1 type II toxin-antitoxin system HicB family antitoxin [Novosphingobium capsulatum]